MGGPKCNMDVLAKLQQLKDNEQKKENTIWKGLDKFRDN
jgi:hypothetical protein